MVSRAVTCLLVLALGALAVDSASAQSRQYAPGVLTVVPPNVQYSETYTGPAEVVEIVKGHPEMDWTPNYTAKSQTVFEKAKMTVVRREVWCLEFAFKPVRSIYVDVPQASGKMQRKLIWYLVYRVRYTGDDMVPLAEADEWGRLTYQGGTAAREQRFFFPQFLLESHEFSKAYQDRIIPAAKKPIQEREVRGLELLNSVEISANPIPLSTADDPHEVWGLVTWEDVDPRIDYFSVYVRGLTNAYQPVDVPGVFKPGAAAGEGRDLLLKTLRLNFWRPGDALDEQEDRVYYGVPYTTDPDQMRNILQAYGLRERVDYSWVYR